MSEASVCCDHPFRASFGEDNDVLFGFLSDGAQAVSEGRRQCVHLGVRFPMILPHIVLKSQITVNSTGIPIYTKVPTQHEIYSSK